MSVVGLVDGQSLPLKSHCRNPTGWQLVDVAGAGDRQWTIYR